MTNDARQQALDYAHQNRERFLEELKDFLAIPSISTSPEHAADVRRAAEWVAGQLSALGMDNVQIMPTGGHPVVYAEQLKAGKDAPTVLIYGHYDIQPVDPLELWKSDPFKAEVRDEEAGRPILKRDAPFAIVPRVAGQDDACREQAVDTEAWIHGCQVPHRPDH